MRIDLLEETLEALEAEGKRPKFIYSIPTFQNPGGVTLSLERRKRLVEIAREREILVVEDNPYGLLRFEGEALPTLYSLDGGSYVVYLGTFSKILSAGLRIGWLVTPTPIREKVVLGKQAADLCTSTLTQDFAGHFFKSGRWREYVAELTGIYRARRDVMISAMAEYFPHGATWNKPSGGLFIWATMPDVLSSEDLLAKSLSRNVAFVPGTNAYVDGRGASSMRLNFSGVKEDQIIEGIRRIGQVAREQLRLYETMTSTDEMKTPSSSSARGELMKVALLQGGRSLERGVSLRSGPAGNRSSARPRPQGRGDGSRSRPGRPARSRSSGRGLHRAPRNRR